MPRKQPNKQITSVTLSPETVRRLKLYAVLKQTSASAVIEQVVGQFLEQQDDVMKLAFKGLLHDVVQTRKKSKPKRTDADNK